MTLIEQVTDDFEALYGQPPPLIVRAPGHVTLLGGHTDYNGGYVLMLNISQSTLIALRAREDGIVNVRSTAANEDVSFDLANFDRQPGHWGDYLRGAAWAMGESEYALRGWDGLIGSDIPVRAGMGASAALVMSTLRAFCEVSGIPFEPLPAAKMGHRAEREWVGQHSTLADMLMVGQGQAGEAMLIDTHTKTFETANLPRAVAVVVMDTGTRRENIQELVAQRQAEIEEVVRAYRVNHLRDLSMSRFEKESDEMNEVAFSRAHHVLTENGRAILAAEMLRSDALATVGKLMNDSQKSLRTDYGISDATVDTLVDCIAAQSNVYGARANGSGNCGTVVALVRDFSADTMRKLAEKCYKDKTGSEASSFVVQPADGLTVISRK